MRPLALLPSLWHAAGIETLKQKLGYPALTSSDILPLIFRAPCRRGGSKRITVRLRKSDVYAKVMCGCQSIGLTNRMVLLFILERNCGRRLPKLKACLLQPLARKGLVWKWRL